MKSCVLRLLIFKYEVVSVMALSCLPIDQHKSQNPITKMWLSYALQDSTLFQATLNFAEVHLDVLSGNYNSQRAIVYKDQSIRAVNAKLRDAEHALSNETIGAVAMLAAIEVCHRVRVFDRSGRVCSSDSILLGYPG